MLTFAHKSKANIMKLTEKVRNYPISILEITIIWIICMIPIPESPLSHVSFIDKWTHFAMYGTLTLIIWWEYTGKHKKSKGFRWNRLLFGGMVCPIIMGILIEFAQAYITPLYMMPGRSGDPFDALCNTLGCILGCAIGTLLVKFRAS